MRKKFIVLIIIIVILGILIALSPDENYIYQENPQLCVEEAIKKARRFVYYYLWGLKGNLIKLSMEPALTKIRNTNFTSLTPTEWASRRQKLKDKKIHFDIYAPISEPKKNNIVLIALEKIEDFIVMTFVYQNGDLIVEIPKKGKMFFSIAVRQIEPLDDRLPSKILRKIANLPILNIFMREKGTQQRLVIIDYKYNYDLHDYYKWALIEGKKYSEELRKSAIEIKKLTDMKYFKKLTEEIGRYSMIHLDFLYMWASKTLKDQPNRIEKAYKTMRQLENKVKIK